MALLPDVGNVFRKHLVRVSVHEEPVAVRRGHISGRYRVSAHEDSRTSLEFVPSRTGLDGRFGRQVVVLVLVECAIKVEGLLVPDTTQTLDELAGSLVPLVMLMSARTSHLDLTYFEPLLADRHKLLLEPPGHNVDGYPRSRVDVDARQRLRRDCRVPWPGQNGRNDVEFLRLRKDGVGEGYALAGQLASQVPQIDLPRVAPLRRIPQGNGSGSRRTRIRSPPLVERA